MPSTEAQRLAHAAQVIRQRAENQRVWDFQSAVAALCGFQPSESVARKALDIGFSPERLALEHDESVGFMGFMVTPRSTWA